MALKHLKVDEALRAGVSGKKIDIYKLMASTTTTLLSTNILFTPSSVPFCSAPQIDNKRITLLEPTSKTVKNSLKKNHPEGTSNKCSENKHSSKPSSALSQKNRRSTSGQISKARRLKSEGKSPDKKHSTGRRRLRRRGTTYRRTNTTDVANSK
ncbi:unnamed protein product [Anisakis simplex]|uniref:Ovule protein n=1 Tax=Anisakis simplex TaxID=6269 RepID=A0A0M3K7I2_ANISI|nr:unnamed protein product [Anisakis simplex]